MKKRLSLLALFVLMTAGSAFSQDTIQFSFTGAPEQFVVPGCVNGDIEILMGGASGGDGGFWPGSGGDGAVLEGTITVSGGDVIDIVIGGQGPCPGAGYNGGGQGFASANGNNQMNSCGGGGSTNLSVNGVPTMIAAGGGGSGGGGTSQWYTPDGGDGGCAQGVTPGNSPFAQGGGGGTQVAPGNGGNPWAGVPPGGSPGVGGTGGMGGQWNTASGGGGGGGYFGGGGGGNDGCCTGANAGAGGGGGSSLWPAGTVNCTQGGNTGNGYLTIILPVCETIICNGDTAFIDFTPQFPAGSSNFTVTPAAFAYQATPGDPNIGFLPNDSTVFQVTANTPGGPQTIDWPVLVYQPIYPDAGLDDSICFDPGVPYNLSGTLHNDGVMSWEFAGSTTFSGGAGTATFGGPIDVPNVPATVDLAGEYMFVIHEDDTNAVCPTGTDTVNIYFSEEVHTTTFIDPSCYGYTDGSIDITSDNGPTSGNIGAVQYSIDNGATWQASPNFTGLGDGTYDIITEDYLGCRYTSQVVLTEPADITLTLVSSDTTICQNGTATLVAVGNNAPVGSTYTYFWSQTTDQTSSVSITPNGVDFTTTVYAQTSDGCYSDTLSQSVTHHDPITVTITPNDSICPGDDASQAVTGNGGFLNGNPDYTYNWTANAIPMASNGSTINVNPTQDTEYCVTVSDVCETTPATICTEVIMRRVPQPIFTSDTTWGCIPTTITFDNQTDPIDVDSITWMIGDEYYYNEDPLKIKFDEAGTYDVWLEVYSEYGCHNDILAPEYITIYPSPDAIFTMNPNPTTIFDPEVHMTNSSVGTNLTYLWAMPHGSPDTSYTENPSVVYPDKVVAQYPVTLTVVNEWGCPDSMLQYVTIDPDILLYAPNIFTPDGDEYNENWRVYIDGIDIYDFHLWIFNRWGEIVWESYDPIGVWNGHYGNGGLVDDGVYIWRIECNQIGVDRKLEFHGHVTVLK